MKFRKFELKDDITQGQYVIFRTQLEEQKPEVWGEIKDLPAEIFYDVLVRAAIIGDWIEDITEDNEYGDDTFWSWAESGLEYIDRQPAGGWPLSECGNTVFERWAQIKTIDPN